MSFVTKLQGNALEKNKYKKNIGWFKLLASFVTEMWAYTVYTIHVYITIELTRTLTNVNSESVYRVPFCNINKKKKNRRLENGNLGTSI